MNMINEIKRYGKMGHTDGKMVNDDTYQLFPFLLLQASLYRTESLRAVTKKPARRPLWAVWVSVMPGM